MAAKIALRDLPRVSRSTMAEEPEVCWSGASQEAGIRPERLSVIDSICRWQVDVGDEMAPLLQDGVQDGAEEERPGLSNLGTTSMTVNTIIGAGILGLPYAFYHSGAWLALG